MTKIIVKIFHLLLKWLDTYKQQQKLKKAQRSRDDLEKDPGKWFADNFNGGVRDKSNRTTTPETDTKPDSKK